MDTLQNKLFDKLKGTILKSYTPRWVVLLIDCTFALASAAIAWAILYTIKKPDIPLSLLSLSFLAVFLFRAATFVVGKTYYGIVRYTGSKDISRIIIVLTLGEFLLLYLNLLFYYIIPKLYIPFYILFIEYISLMFLMSVSRIIFRIIFHQGAYVKKKRVVIYGSGESALSVKYLMENSHDIPHKVEAFIDEEISSIGKTIENVPVYGFDKIGMLLANNHIDKFVFAGENIPRERKQEVFDLCLSYDTTILEAPDFDGWIEGSKNIHQIRKINIEDLLNRGEIFIDETNLRKQLYNKTVLVTGAAGSIGSEIVRQLIGFGPARIILFDQAETPLHNMELELTENPKCRKFHIEIGDVRDLKRVESIFTHYNPDVVYHAAAYKHVPMMEAHPLEGVKTNVIGTKNVADCAAKYKADSFVMISTDKAVNPTNVMGASKRIAEMYVQSLYLVSKTKFITTRFGNVLGSNGSVVHRFRQQIKEGGPVTVTHPDITRFFMTISEACRLVLQAGDLGHGGEIFIFDMGESVKIVSLAKKMIKLSGLRLNQDISISFTGLRPGEKLFEEVLNDEETTLPTQHSKIKVAKVRECDYMKVNKAIKELERLLDEQDNFEIVRQMKLLVPEFKSENSIYTHLDLQIEKEVEREVKRESKIEAI